MSSPVQGIVIGAGQGQAGSGTLVVVPDVFGATRDDAVGLLESRGFVVRVEDIESLAAEGTVFSQNPVAGSRRARGSVVTLQIRQRSEPPTDINRELTELKAAVAALDTLLRGVDAKVDALGTAVSEVDAKVVALGTAVNGVDAKVVALDAKVETDTAAAGRQTEILAKLEEISNRLESHGGPPSTSTTTKRS